MRFRVARLADMTTVLVVDDEPMVRDVVSRYLERDGHRVVTAEDGESARGLIERASVGPLEIDAAKREAHRNGDLLSLTAKEFDLLWFFASNPNRVFSREQLMHRVWGYSAALDTGTVTVHVRRLREKLEEDASKPRLLETVWGVGYRLSP